ncbi:MAG: hypothetical protein U0835_04855 [Isosphaeraceae bacterium]
MAGTRRTYSFGLAERDPDHVTVEKQIINPFTQQPTTVRANVHKPWPPERTDAVNGLLEHHYPQNDDNGYSVLTLPDGTELQICFGYEGGGGEGSEANIVCEEVSEAAAQFLIELLGAANLVLVRDPAEGVPAAVIGPPANPESAGRWPGALVIETPRDLIRWLQVP